VLELDHIGYAVADIGEYLRQFLEPLFQPKSVSSVVEDPVQRVRVAFVTLASGERIELIEPIDDTSPVSRILKARRGGLYHLCFAVDALEPAIEQFRQRGCLLVSGPVPAVAFEGRPIAFLHTPQRDLIELVESKTKAT
jgi:methylmalonyl-CoA/ethylmalonyl-CoA epimerase